MSKITPQDLVGRRGINYHDEFGTIIASEYVMDYKKISQHDNSGWMTREVLKRELELEELDILVAFHDDFSKEVQVYTFGIGGVDLAEDIRNIEVH